MAARLTIISTPVGGIPEVLKNYEYKTFIRNCRSIEISNVILRLIKEIDVFQENNVKDGYMDNFSWEKIADRIERIYQNICHRDNLDLQLIPVPLYLTKNIKSE